MPAGLVRMAYSSSVVSYIRQHGLDAVIAINYDKPAKGIQESVDPANTEPYAADWDDLVRLHRLVLERKVTTVLEFGVGKSTAVLAHALQHNEKQHGRFVRANLRRNNPFELHSVDDLQSYIDRAKSLLPAALAGSCCFHHAAVRMATLNGRICTLYDSLPNVCPDFIYLDAPSQASAMGTVRGITTNQPDRFPMSGDILAIEHFLLPGTMIVVDGRSANARFLKQNFQRNWTYRHDEADDIHLFELREKPLGKLNRLQIEYCLGVEWLKDL